MGKMLGRGTIYLMSAQMVFLMVGYTIHFGLGRYLGPVLYGIFGIMLSFLVIYRVLMQSGTVGAVSKYIAENVSLANSIRNQAMKFQIFFALVTFVLLFTTAPLIAKLLRDSTLTPYIRFTTLFIPVFAVYSVYEGSLNGIRAFGKQAKVSLIYNTTKVSAVFILVFLGFKIYGVIGAYLIASLVALLIARHYWTFKSSEITDNFEIGKIVRFALPVILFFSAFNLVMSLDLFFVKAILRQKSQIGFYTSAGALSRIPYSIFLALNQTLFPSIAKSTSKRGSAELTKKYINQSLRYLLIFLLPGSFVISTTSKNLVSLIYTDRYLAAASPLSILIFGMTFLSVFIILTTIITASGRPRVSLMIALLLLGVNIILNAVLVPIYGLAGAAVATTISGFLGVLIAAVYVYKHFQTLTSLLSLFRITGISLIIYLVARNFPVSGILLILYYVGLLLIYFALLFIFREIKKEDIQVIKDVFQNLRG